MCSIKRDTVDYFIVVIHTFVTVLVNAADILIGVNLNFHIIELCKVNIKTVLFNSARQLHIFLWRELLHGFIG